MGFTYKKTSEIPCEADHDRQEEFMKELSRVLEKKDAKSIVYYADGVHPTHNSRSTYAWIEKGEEFPQPTVSGRDRVNINGLLNAYDVTDVIAHDCDSVNALSTKALYEKALIKHPEASVIYISYPTMPNIIGIKICGNGSKAQKSFSCSYPRILRI